MKLVVYNINKIRLLRRDDEHCNIFLKMLMIQFWEIFTYLEDVSQISHVITFIKLYINFKFLCFALMFSCHISCNYYQLLFSYKKYILYDIFECGMKINISRFFFFSFLFFKYTFRICELILQYIILHVQFICFSFAIIIYTIVFSKSTPVNQKLI